jgi:UDP-arabinose 4-epimerase
MQILVTVGAGYVESHTAKHLAQVGHEPIVLDSLRYGNRWAVRWGPLEEMDLSDRPGLDAVFQKYQISAVIHFAAVAYVGESMHDPAGYFRNNVVNSMNLLDAMRKARVGRIVFSSTCATYGDPQHVPMREDHPQKPVNPYGESKLMMERLLQWYGQAYGLGWTALRYFNAAGADPQGEIGEVHDPETHLIPRAIAAARGDLPALDLYGTDYPTPDGSAVRDYIHVSDLATAHLKALTRLEAGGGSAAYNLGTGHGHSVREVIATVEKVARCKVPVNECPRRAGDPPVLVADVSRVARDLEWVPDYSLETVVETAWQWYKYFQRKGMPDMFGKAL